MPWLVLISTGPASSYTPSTVRDIFGVNESLTDMARRQYLTQDGRQPVLVKTSILVVELEEEERAKTIHRFRRIKLMQTAADDYDASIVNSQGTAREAQR